MFVLLVPGWYSRLVRDEILAEWEFISQDEAVLHVHCHVSGEERWLAPPLLRDYIFRREMQLVRRRPNGPVLHCKLWLLLLLLPGWVSE